MAELDTSRFFNVSLTVTDGGFFKAGTEVLWSMRTASDTMCKFYYITEGECEITILGETYRAKAGDWFFIPARVEHSYHNLRTKPFKKYWMHFDVYPRKDIVKLLGINYYLRLSDTKRVDELFERFTSLYGSDDFADRLSVKSIALELISLFVRYSKKEKKTNRLSITSAFSNVFVYVENNMSVKIENKTLADISHMHPTHFIRCFKKETGQTPQDYINQRKMERAKHLLESTELQISEISEILGFFDSMHFSKSFKKRYSITPSAYRKIYFKES